MASTLSKLIEDLHNEQNFITRVEAISLLSEGAYPEKTDLLLSALNDPYFKVREKAAQALKSVQDPIVIPPLVAAITDIPSVRDAALEALKNRALQPETQSKISFYQDSYTLYTQRLALKEKNVIDSVQPARFSARLNDSDFLEREAFVQQLGNVHTPEALIALTEAASDLYLSVRERAIRGIRTYEGPLNISFLKQALNTTNWTLFDVLVDLLLARSFPAATDLLVSLLQHEGYIIRRRARAGLSRFNNNKYLSILIDSLSQWDSNEMAIPAYTIAQLYKDNYPERVSYFSDAMLGLMGNIVEKDWPSGIEALNNLAREGEWRHLAFFCKADLDRRDQFDVGAVLDRTHAVQKKHEAAYLCTQHLARFKSYSYDSNNFLACRICTQTHRSIRVSNLVAVLDIAMTEPVVLEKDIYRVNWLQNRSKMDLDAIEIGSCPEEFITDFCIDTGNDTDPRRVQIYKKAPCYIQKGVRLLPETLNMLNNQFNQVIRL